MTHTNQNLIGSREACEMLGIDRATLSRWVALGRLGPAHQLPGVTGARLFKRSEVETLRDHLAAS